MSTQTQSSTVVSRRYAGALLDLAEESKALAKVEKDLDELAAMMLSSSDLATMIASPLTTRADQEKAAQKLAEKAKFQKLTKNFLGVLAQNGRLNILPAILRDVESEMTKRRGELVANVETAVALTDKQTKALQKEISKAMGRDVMIEATVNPDIMGGMVVTAGSYMIDDSVKRKLERLRSAMSGSANENVNLKEVV